MQDIFDSDTRTPRTPGTTSRSQFSLSHRAQGFTLLEVLVAMSIFAVMSLSAYKMLRTVIQAHDRTQGQIETFSAYTKALSVMERDFSQMVPRSVKDQYGDPVPPLIMANGSYIIEFSRVGWNNPLRFPRSNLQRVAYELTDEGELKRWFWLVLDRAEDSEPIEQTLLTGVDDFQVNLIERDSSSPVTGQTVPTSTQLPLGAEVILTSDAFGDVRKVYAFVEAPMSNTTTSGSGQGQKNGNSTDGRDSGRQTQVRKKGS
jgi:general secretion pathway protein J